ncbi:MAG TPA: hypothetical protein VI522_08290, partial [Gammaproteobacteria bacterium]|nr:hypothetical protein [Gammaproteobacteria bacterium]
MFFTHSVRDGAFHLALQGSWNIQQLPAIQAELKRLPISGYQKMEINAEHIEEMDTAGAWLLTQFIKKLKKLKVTVHLSPLQDKQQCIYDRIKVLNTEPLPLPLGGVTLINIIIRLGEGTVNALRQVLLLLSFIGLIFITLVQVLIKPSRIRFTSIIRHID